MSITGGKYWMTRGWQENKIFAKEKFTEREAWLYLIENSAYSPHVQGIGRHRVSVARGQFVTSDRFLAKAWDWSKSRVNRYLCRLKIETMIETLGGTDYTLISVCNYDYYQGPDEFSGTPSGTPSGTRAGHERDKAEERKIKERRYTPEFDQFWAKFPKDRAGSKDKAFAAWGAAIKRATSSEIILAVDGYASSDEVAKGYAKGAAAWLNDDRWTVAYRRLNGGSNGFIPFSV